jgi:hypothetical protein
MEVVGRGLISCPVAGFVVCNFEHTDSSIRESLKVQTVLDKVTRK